MSDEHQGRIIRHVDDVRHAVNEFLAKCETSIIQASEMLISSLRGGGKVLICGNGGSSADALHMAAELVSSFEVGLGRKGLPVLALPSNVATLTAFANDFDFDGVFARQVQAFGQQGDVLLAISTSGDSENVIRACDTAREWGLRVIGLTGLGQSRLSSVSDLTIGVPGKDTQVIQTLHLMVEHLLCGYIEDAFIAESIPGQPSSTERSQTAPRSQG